MKHFILAVLSLHFALFVTAQSSKYTEAMEKNIVKLDSMMEKNNAADLSNNFLRIAEAEKTQWLPYYYAAYTKAVQAFSEKDNTQKDALADKAAEYLSKAETILGKENSEFEVIKSLVATAHMMVDPQTRYTTYGSEVTDHLKKAEALDPGNPRPVLLEALNTFYTPEDFGGGKDAAKPLFDQAKQLYDVFKPETPLSPGWGQSNLNYFLAQYK